MSTPQAFVNEYYAAFNRREFDAYPRFFTSDCELVAPGVQARGIDAVREFDGTWAGAFLEARIESLRMAESGNTVVTGNWFHGGRHIQALQTPAGTIPASNKLFFAPYCAMLEIEQGRIRKQSILFEPDYVAMVLGGR